jgi:hypothetical protein
MLVIRDATNVAAWKLSFCPETKFLAAKTKFLE